MLVIADLEKKRCALSYGLLDSTDLQQQCRIGLTKIITSHVPVRCGRMVFYPSYVTIELLPCPISVLDTVPPNLVTEMLAHISSERVQILQKCPILEEVKGSSVGTSTIPDDYLLAQGWEYRKEKKEDRTLIHYGNYTYVKPDDWNESWHYLHHGKKISRASLPSVVLSKFNGDYYYGPALSGYRMIITEEGRKKFRFNNRVIAQKKIPSEIMKALIEKAPKVSRYDILKEHKGDGTGFMYSKAEFNGTTRNYYFFNGFSIPKKDLPPEAFESMKDRQEYFKDRFSSYYSQTHSNSRDYTSYTSVSVTEQALKLLEDQGIASRKDWKKWMLKHHPDRNPDTSLELVQLVNSAVELIYPADD